MSTPRDLMADAVRRLTEAGVDSPGADARILLAHVLDLDLSRLPLVEQVAPDRAAAYAELVARRAAREPLQHLTGVAHFRHVSLRVGPGVFVPRPETELLAGWVVERLSHPEAPQEPVVVDLGTGSGAIAKAVAEEVPGARVHAVELDDGAHAWAARNLSGTGVELRHGDLACAFDELLGTVDVVVSNPPYIPHEAWESVAPEVRDHDPQLALYATGDGLDVVRAVEVRAALLLRPGGLVGVEHADVQGESVPAVFTAAGRWEQVRDHPDLSGRPRFTTARLAWATSAGAGEDREDRGRPQR